jgi:hypothetical protein
MNLVGHNNSSDRVEEVRFGSGLEGSRVASCSD